MSFVKILDLRSLLPKGWSRSIEEAAREFGTRVVTDGGLSSRQDSTRRGTDYTVVSGEMIVQHLKWLDELYRGQLLDLASNLVGKCLFPARSERYGLNINMLNTKGSGYEWHFDSNVLTIVLFACSLPSHAGGELLIRTTEGVDLELPPIKGFAVAFTGDELEHSVAPLAANCARISVPFSFFSSAEQLVSEDLQNYLYGGSQEG